jgi:WhiB family transcriptional regulator, redox-sensing transcriptional regulator
MGYRALKGVTVTIQVARSPDIAELTNNELQVRVASPEARCAVPSADPDDWFPLSVDPAHARRQAAHAIALCQACPVRAECLELSLRLWHGAGHHGVWGGMVEAERRTLRDEWLRGVTVVELLHWETHHQTR